MNVFVGAIFIFFGLRAIVLFLRTYRKNKQRLSWPSTLGRIVSVDIVEGKDEDGRTYQPTIRYEYTVGGERYFSDERWAGFRRSYRHLGQAQKSVKQYSAGEPISVFFNPQAAEEAVLEPGMSGAWAALAFGSAFVSAGLLFLTLCWSRDCFSGAGP